MFRIVAHKALTSGAWRTVAPTAARAWSAAAPAPSVKDLLIDLTFVDPSGARRKVKGLVGK